MTAAPVRPGIWHRYVTAGHAGQEMIRPCELIMSPSQPLHRQITQMARHQGAEAQIC